MIQLHDAGGSVSELDRRWRRVMERRVRSQCGPGRASMFDEAWGDLLCATWRSGRGPIDDEGQMWAVLQTFLGYVEGHRSARAARTPSLGADLQYFPASSQQRRRIEPAWVADERRRGGVGFEAVWMVAARGLSYSEACEVLGVNRETLKGRLKHGRASLRRRWAGKDVGAMWTSEERAAVDQAIGELMRGGVEAVAESVSGLLEELGVDPEKVTKWVSDSQ